MTGGVGVSTRRPNTSNELPRSYPVCLGPARAKPASELRAPASVLSGGPRLVLLCYRAAGERRAGRSGPWSAARAARIAGRLEGGTGSCHRIEAQHRNLYMLATALRDFGIITAKMMRASAAPA